MAPGPSSFKSSARGKSSTKTGLINSEVARALKERLQVTSGDDTFRVLGEGSMEKTVLSWRTGLAFLASSMICVRLSLSITVLAGDDRSKGRCCDGGCGSCCDLSLRRLRARSPSEGGSSCAHAGMTARVRTRPSALGPMARQLGNARRMKVIGERSLLAPWMLNVCTSKV